MITKSSPDRYLTLMEKQKINPNFYTSLPYILLSGAECFEENGLIWIEADGWMIYPPIIGNWNKLNIPLPLKRIWSDFSNLENKYYGEEKHLQFLDWEYIFDPLCFQCMEGKRWETYRKNVRKWPRNNPNWEYKEITDMEECFHLIGYWFEEKADNLQDADLMIKFLENENNVEGIFKKGLYCNGKLVAINVWDENYKYINYRYCFVDHCERFLDEFVRFQFYSDPDILSKRKLINDGGTLDNEGLEKFKDKLNPIRKRKVYSYII